MPPVTDAPAPPCLHLVRDDRGVCTACGHCLHDIVLNGACLYCGSTDLDPVAMSPRPPAAPPVIPLDRLRRKRD